MRMRGNGVCGSGRGSRLGRREMRKVDGAVALDDEIHVRRIELHFLEHERALPDRGELRVDDQAAEARDRVARLLGQRGVANAQPERERVEGNVAEREAAPESSLTYFCALTRSRCGTKKNPASA